MPYPLSVGSQEKRAVRAFWLRIEKKYALETLKQYLAYSKCFALRFF